ncbi:hypothetical protein EJB05_55420 [Eragrostis curvula]|uniref:Uncharacterized protein n=2 Tax=Eragrostis curvula TaxID=38414 RepID=A0A5J9SJS5_9POAL|nr:hypothetical protein EJB05_55420 [Eragrostis curvula]
MVIITVNTPLLSRPYTILCKTIQAILKTRSSGTRAIGEMINKVTWYKSAKLYT